MNEDLEARIKQRIQDAKNKKIDEKAKSIARNLGNGDCKEYASSGHEEYNYIDEKFSIHTFKGWSEGCYGSDTEIKFREEIEFKEEIVYQYKTDNVCCFKPGNWETPFEKLYLKGIAEFEKKQKEAAEQKMLEQEKRETEQKKNFGLE